MNCQTCGIEMTGRKRKYCAKTCRVSYVAPTLSGLDACQNCGKQLQRHEGRGRSKRNCSRACSDRYRQSRLKAQRQTQHKCEVCETAFTTGKKDQRFCSATCRHIGQAEDRRIKEEQRIANLYPDGIRTEPCGWCGEPRSFHYKTGSITAYHDACRKEAQSARYRIKTVKRQKLSSRHRISHEAIVREYGDICHICNKQIDLNLPRTHRYGLTADHLIPISKNGTDDMSNLRPAHWICNVKKSNKPLESINA